ncbi:MAG: DUF4832 domain-containing protein [Crocinitomicaceae bacterium]
MKYSKLFLIVCLCFSMSAQSQSWQNLTLDENVAGLHENPIRGLIPGFPGIRNFPYSMEFFYLPLRNTMLGIDSLDWTEFETQLEAIADEGNTAVVRFYMDYPTQSVATPQFLINAGITMNAYTDYGNAPGQSLSPDYNDPITMNALLNFIQNFGAAYDGDPRISIVQGGIIGFWGEWHTYPQNNLNMSEPNKALIFQAFIDAFPNTHVNIRQPQDGVTSATEMMVGYHDDSFMQSTIGPELWHFWPRIIDHGVEEVWKNNPIGGEIYPGLQSTVWDVIPNPSGQDFQVCVDSTHATYMLNHGIFDDAVGSTTHLNALEQNKKFGYQFYVSAVKLNSFVNGNIDLDVRIENNGVAPFYYNWDVEFALFQNSTITSLGTTDWNIPSFQPGAVIESNFSSNQLLDTGEYTLLMRFVNPLTALKPNAKQLRFTNAEQDADSNGWISLLTAEYSTLGLNSLDKSTNLIVYPNPTDHTINIHFASEHESATVDILDLEQRVVCNAYEGVLSQGEHALTLECDELPAGEYIVRIKKKSGLVHSKLVKVK